MASQVFPETVDVVDLLQAAKAHGFSCHGEMFNSDAMASLAESINSMEATVRRDVLCNPRTVLEILMQGDLILVPYPFLYLCNLCVHLLHIENFVF